MKTAHSVPTVADLLRSKPLIFDASTPAEVAEQLLVLHGLSGAPVVDAVTGTVGVLSHADLVRARGDGRAHLEGRTAGELMAVPTISSPPDLTLGGAAELMASHGVDRLVVVAADLKPMGLVTAFDLIRAVAADLGGELHAPAN